MTKQIELSRQGGFWVACYKGDKAIIELFGTDTIPTPYMDTMPHEQVLIALQRRNSDAYISFLF